MRKRRKGKRRRDFDPAPRSAVEARKAILRPLGCIACRLEGYCGVPPEFHHPRAGVGGGQRASDMQTLPLCSAHHRGDQHPAIPSIHRDKLKFIARYGTEAELLARTAALLESEAG